MSQAAPALLAWFKPRVRKLADPLARLLVRLGVSANAITVSSVVANAGVAVLLGQGLFVAGGIALLLVNALDFLDGAVARLSGQASDFGAFLDSVCDRYSELLVFLGLVVWYGGQGDQVALAVVFLATAGSVMVSYTRARAEGLGYGGEVGLLQRPERIVLLGIGLLLTPWLLFWILVLLAVLTNVTAVQRIVHVRRQVGERRR